jgi:formate dehydrogenase major subunit
MIIRISDDAVAQACGADNVAAAFIAAGVEVRRVSSWGTNCPEYKVTAVQISASNGPTDWREDYEALSERSRRIEAEIPAE